MEAGPLMLIALIGAHCFFDYAGQGDFMAKAKNEYAPIPNIPARTVIWSHAAIHGSVAALITGVWPIFLFETFIHAITDTIKCKGSISFNQDQFIHVICKVVWFTIAMDIQGKLV